MYKLKLFYLVFANVFFGQLSCAKKSMNERDAKREQVRSSAQTKKQELLLTAGQYYGQLKKDSYNQDVLLTLEVKSVPAKTGEDVDPILVPILAGSLKVFFGSQEQGEYYSLSIDKADFDEKRKKLDLVASSDSLKEIILSLDQTDLSLQGLWSSPSSATSGEVFLKKYEDLKLLKSEGSEIRGDYFGTLNWEGKKLHQFGKLNIATKQDKQSTVSLLASVKLFSGNDESTEVMVYNLDQVEFNPLTHKISLNGEKSEVYFVGEWAAGVIRGLWYSKLYGKLGSAIWQTGQFAKPQESTTLMQPIRGVYYGSFKNSSENSHLPSRFMISLVSYHDQEKPGSLGVTGNIRYYYGSYSSKEYIEFPFEHLEYNYFTRNLDAITSGPAKFALDLTIGDSTLSGTIADEALGAIGSFEGTQGSPVEETKTMGGSYQGYFTWDKEQSYQTTNLELVPSFKNQEGIKIMSSLSMLLGKPTSNEKLFFNFQEANFSPTSGFVVMQTEDGRLTLKGYLYENSFVGEWFTQSLGKVGNFKLSKSEKIEPPSNLYLVNSLKGIYQGALQNTSSQTNLPERIMIGLVSTPDSLSPYGLKLTSNLRFYLGPFDSDEFVEGSCENVQFDFFTKILAMKCTTPGMNGLSINGQIAKDGIVGKLFYDSLGEIGDFKVDHL